MTEIERVIKIHYWIDGNAIYGAEAEYYKGSFWRKPETVRMVKQYDSEEKALEGLETLRKEAGYKKDLPFGKRHFSSMPE